MKGVIHISREELYQKVWSVPASRLAADFGISDVALNKTCKRMGIPRPPRGYWARLAAGQEQERLPLPPPKEGRALEVKFDLEENVKRRSEWAVLSPAVSSLAVHPPALSTASTIL